MKTKRRKTTFFTLHSDYHNYFTENTTNCNYLFKEVTNANHFIKIVTTLLLSDFLKEFNLNSNKDTE